MPFPARFALLVALLAAPPAFGQAVPVPPELADYIARPEPDFAWSKVDTTTTDAGTVHTLKLTSQKWHGELWEHPLQVFVAKGVTPGATFVLYNDGAREASPTRTVLGFEIARRLNCPLVMLGGVPKQPLFGGKKEDALIAETFVRYLETGDGTWPLLFPMAKSVVQAMTAVQQFAKDDLKAEVTGFVVTGASKRGWTSWLTAASGDKRVKAIAPMVIDTLNFPKQMPNQLKSFGRYSEMIHDYEERKLLPLPDTDRARKLWAMVDPWVYRDKLTLPKLLINGTNDPYWAQDALNLYWDDLPGPKAVCYVANAGHGLRPEETPNVKGGKVDPFPMQGINSLAAFSRLIVAGKPVPKLTWKHGDGGGGPVLSVEADPPAKTMRGWAAESDTRDFRKSKWKKIESAAAITSKGELTVGRSDKFQALFGEAEFDVDGVTLTLSTQIRIIEPKQ